tara:strand:- start:467 stop:847 length:381 start_codon:yes stop_codon:yes gene_type:complete
MAATKTTTMTALGGNLVVDFDADNTEANNVTGNTSGTLYLIEIDNTANASTAAYVRIRDAASADNTDATNGVPTWVFYAAAASTASYTMPLGTEYSAGLSMWCTSNNAAQNDTAPSSAVVVKLIAS